MKLPVDVLRLTVYCSGILDILCEGFSFFCFILGVIIKFSYSVCLNKQKGRSESKLYACISLLSVGLIFLIFLFQGATIGNRCVSISEATVEESDIGSEDTPKAEHASNFGVCGYF